MKLFVHYDATGAIRSIVTVNAPEQFSVMLTPSAGLLVGEVEETEIPSGAAGVEDAAGLEELRKFGRAHKVVTPNRVKLTKKT